jgi:hypothetical protein
MARRFLLAAAAVLVLLASFLGSTAAEICPTFATKASIRKTIRGGKHATLTVKVTNRRDAVTNAGLGLQLPNGATYKSVNVSPKLTTAPTFEESGGMLAWTGIVMPPRKARTFKIKLAFDKCAGGDPVPPKHPNGKATNLYTGDIVISTFTGPVDDMGCVSTQTAKVRTRAGDMYVGMSGDRPPPLSVSGDPLT